MFYQLFQLLLLLGFYIIKSSEWNFLLNLDENDQLLCYSCKGIECEQITNNDKKKIICNKKTQLCWVKKNFFRYYKSYFYILKAGFIDHKPYRTCANRYCTPNDFSLDSDIHIETCCRSNLCNSISRKKIFFSNYCFNYLSNSFLVKTRQIIQENFFISSY
jgi:hypothetical protein